MAPGIMSLYLTIILRWATQVGKDGENQIFMIFWYYHILHRVRSRLTVSPPVRCAIGMSEVE